MRSIGIDFGSVNTKVVVLGDGGEVELTLSRRKAPDDLEALAAFFDSISSDPAEPFRAGVVGLTDTAARTPRLFRTNALLSIAAGIRHLHPAARSVVEIGGHTAKFVVLESDAAGGGIRDFATNEACAAGTGSFLEQQAKRLDLSVEELARLSIAAKSGARVAGRCSVFAKSDMIHLQQKATPVAEIAYGLCLAIARNARTTLLKGRDIEGPLVVAGGCASNAGVVRAFREIADRRLEIIVSEHPGFEAAIGVAATACEAENDGIGIEQLLDELPSMFARTARSSRYPSLTRPAAARLAEPSAVHADPFDGYLGVDVGSVSTDLVLLDARGEVVSSVYLPTRGRPVDVVLEGLAILRSRFPSGLRVIGCGATGSGRYLAARLLGADVVKNEITCQVLGARRFVPEVDTILEIGGQDSKFVSLKRGSVSDFAMNKICAAGTGSFLEEQAREMGIDIQRDFAARAFGAAAPADLGTRCTVFMEIEVVNALRNGVSVDDICAGLAFSIVKNYLDKVVGSRRLGDSIVFQGGVASNDAVVAAFEHVIGKPLHVHPYNRISGAIGAAVAAMEGQREGRTSRFRGIEPRQAPSLRSFECRHCSNRCEVNVLNVDGAHAFFGDTCERYTTRAHEKPTDGLPPNLAEEYVQACEASFDDAAPSAGLTIGIPRASTLFGSLPFWAAFFKALGHRPVLSAPTTEETFALGLKRLSVGVCLPIKLTAGHFQSLLARGVDLVFLPSVVHLPGDDPSHSYACPYAMAVPFMVGNGDSATTDARALTPVLSLRDEEAFVDGFSSEVDRLETTTAKVREAWHRAVAAQEIFDAAFRARSAAALRNGTHRYAVAILGKPYNTLDPWLNLSIFERLRRLNVLAVPQKFLPVDTAGLASDLPWRFSADIHVTAAAVARTPDLYPIIVSNFGCGPDAFTFKQIEAVAGDTPHLVLEFDEHRGEAGLITRIEAFLDQLDATSGAARPRVFPRDEAPAVPPPGASVFLPYFADHAHAYCGLMRLNRCDARVLPPPDDAIRAMGEQYSLGKECHAYSMIVGDLINVSRRSNGENVYFYFPGTSLPCLLHEYGRGMRTLLRELGITNVTVCAPTGGELFSAFPLDAMERFYLGLLAIELLVKGVCQIRPYECERGMTDAIHRQNLLRIEDAVAGGNVLDTLDEALGELATIPARRDRNRPVVGMAGDVYTKTNAAANNDLARWLEDQGMEVWPSPFQIDLLDFGISRSLSNSVAKLDLSGLLLNGSVAALRAIHQWRVRRVVGTRVARQEEPGYQEMKKQTARYMPNDSHELLYMNIARIVDFANRGADGIINAICFNCMIGNASAAVVEKIRGDFDNVPIITAVYAGGEDPSRRMVLEAFVSQVAAHHARRRSSTPPHAGGIGALLQSSAASIRDAIDRMSS